MQSLASGAAGRKHEFCALEDAGHILVLYQANDRELVEPCLDVLRKKNKKVQACVYVTGDPEADASCIPVHAKKDVNVWQVPSDVVLERFKTVKADILIDLTRPDCYPMQYLMLQHPCRFKVGVKHADISGINDVIHRFGQQRNRGGNRQFNDRLGRAQFAQNRIL